MQTPPAVRLANDIAEQFAHLPPDAAAAAVAKHIAAFWDPRMRAQLDQHARARHIDLSPLARAAAALLTRQQVGVEPPRS